MTFDPVIRIDYNMTLILLVDFDDIWYCYYTRMTFDPVIRL